MNALSDIFRRKKDASHAKIDLILLHNLYQQGIEIGVTASFICSLLVLLSHIAIQFNKAIIIWFSCLCLLLLFRILLSIIFKRQKQPENNMSFWMLLYTISVALNGLGWGLLGTYWFSYQSSLQQQLALLILCGMCAGSVPLLSHFISTSVAFLLPALLPLIITQCYEAMNINILFAMAASVFLIYLIVLSFKMNTVIRKSLGLRFENDKLLYSLSDAKSKLELINKQLEITATHDSLTHMANRNLFVGRLNQAVINSLKNKNTLFLFYMDIDQFKDINDRYGHIVGDKLLIVVAQRIKHLLRKDDLLSRLGGDEFTIILENRHDRKIIAAIAKRICEAIEKPIHINQHTIQTYLSIGISYYPDDGQSADELIKAADDTMYYAKQHGGNHFLFYHDIAHLLQK